MAYLSVVHTYRLHLHSESQFQIQDKQHQVDNSYLNKIVKDQQSWFQQIEVIDSVYHQFFFLANIMGCQSMTSLYFPPVTLQTLIVAAAAVHGTTSDYAW
jgi:hypothetical protein